MKKVSKKKGLTSHLLAAATVATFLGSVGRLEAETSRVHYTAPAPLPATDRSLMDAERSLLHSLTSEVTKPAEPAKLKSTKREQPAVAKRSMPQAELPQKPSSQAPVAEAPVAEVVASQEGKPLQQVQLNETRTSAPLVAIEAKEVELRSRLGTAEGASDALRQELHVAQERIAHLERQLDQSRSQLAIAETEVSRLSGLLDSKTRASLGKYNLPLPAAAPAKPVAAAPAAARRSSTQLTQPPVEVRPPAADADLQVATVAVEKAELRLGPGKNHSALMSLRRGSRLMVEARQGEWYRVFAPNGDRAWIAASLVTFGDGGSSLNDGSSVRVKGYTANAEEEAFRRVHRSAN